MVFAKVLFTKVLKWLLVLGSSVLVLFALLWGALQVEVVQTWTVNTSSMFFSNTLGARVTVGRVNIKLLRGVVLEDVFVTTLENDTILKVKEAGGSIKKISFSTKTLDIGTIVLVGAKVFVQEDSSGHYNVAELLDFNDVDTVKQTWKCNIRGIKIKESELSFKRYKQDSLPASTVNFDNIKVNRLNVDIHDIRFREDVLQFEVDDISFVERCGFELRGTKGRVNLAGNGFNIRDMAVVTPHSALAVGFAFVSCSSLDSTKDFCNDLHFNVKILRSTFSTRDVAYFVPLLRDMDKEVEMKGLFKGTINDISVRNLEFSTLGETSFVGNADITGLPDIPNTYFHLNILRFKTSVKDLKQLPLPPFGSGNNLSFPAGIDPIGSIAYRGRLTGYVNEMVSYGKISTDLGVVHTDVMVKIDSLKNTSVRGRLQADNFFAGRLANMYPHLGIIDMDANINCVFNSSGLESAELEGSFPRVEINKYLCSNVRVQGVFSSKHFDGDISIHDPGANVNFSGKCDFSGLLPLFDFKMRIASLNLATFNLSGNDSLSFLSLNIDAKVSGNDIDNLDGTVVVDSLVYENSVGQAFEDTICLRFNRKGNKKEVLLRSDIVDARVAGLYTVSGLKESVSKTLNSFAPSLLNYRGTASSNRTDSIQIDVTIKDISPIVNVMKAKVTQQGNITLSASLCARDNSIAIYGSVPSVGIGGWSIKNISFVSRTEDDKLVMNTTLTLPVYNIQLDTIVLHGEVHNDSLRVSCSWFDNDSLLYKGTVAVAGSFSRDSLENLGAVFDVKPTTMTLANVPWVIDSSSLGYAAGKFFINNLLIHDGAQQVSLHGLISTNNNDSLTLQFSGFNLGYFNRFATAFDLGMAGTIDGHISFFNLPQKPFFHSQVRVTNLWFAGYEAGDLSLISGWDVANQDVKVEVFTLKNGVKHLDIRGVYYPDDDYIDMGVVFDKFNLSVLSFLFDGVFSDISGGIDGKARFWGKLSDPKLDGYLDAKMATFKIDYLNTHYWFSGRTFIKNNKLIFKDINGYDSEDDTGTPKGKVNGDVIFKSLYGIHYNVVVTANNLRVLDTKLKDNEYFFGQAYASGVVKIDGDLTQTNINASARSMPNTVINIPLSDDIDIEGESFFSFRTKDNSLANKTEKAAGEESMFKGVVLNIDLDITDNAEVQMILDEKVGDIIRARGDGSILLSYDLKGNFNVFGTYEIASGDYLFTMSNMLNKKFEVQKGSKLTWNGDMTGATSDITATYKLKTSLAPLMKLVNDTDDVYKRRVPANCVIKLSDKIMKPTIDFDVDLDEGNEKAKEVFNNLGDDEKNKQFISLLVINSFFFDNTSEDNAFMLNSTEVVSNQLSNWLSKINKDVNVGVSYRPATNTSNTEVELAMSTEILQNRVVLNLNGYTEIGSNTTTENDNGIMGDVSVEVKLNKKGTLRAKGFNRTNNDNIIERKSDTQGIGIFFSQSFDKLADLVRSRRKRKPTDDEDKQPSDQNNPTSTPDADE